MSNGNGRIPAVNDTLSQSVPGVSPVATLLVNAHSRRGRAQFEPAVAALRGAGIQLAQAHAVESKNEMQAALAREIEAGTPVVIVGGGDGTLSECAAHLVHTDTAMGVLPLGTGNTFARSLGIPLGLDAAARTIAAGRVQQTDVGVVNGRVFLNSVTLGLSSEIAHALSEDIKKKWGLLAWPIVGIRVLLNHRAFVLEVTAPGRSFHVRTHQFVVANGRFVAGPIAAAPDASIQSREFDVFVLGGARKSSLARSALRWVLGRHVHSGMEHYFRSPELVVHSKLRKLAADVDGEIAAQTPLSLQVDVAALRVIVPEKLESI